MLEGPPTQEVENVFGALEPEGLDVSCQLESNRDTVLCWNMDTLDAADG